MPDIRITAIETKPHLDPYHADTGQPSRTVLRLDPATGEVQVYQDYDTNGTSEAIWHGRIREYPINGHPLEKEMQQFILDSQELLQRIVDGYEDKWNGSNHIGVLDEDASEAESELLAEIDSFNLDGGGYSWCLIEDWCAAMEPMTGEETDTELMTAAANIYDQAAAENMVFGKPVFDYLCQLRDEAKAQKSEE